MKKLLIILMLLNVFAINNAFAAPKVLEVIFLSSQGTSSVIHFLNQKTIGIFYSKLLSQNSGLDYEEEYVIDFSAPEGFDDVAPMKNFECVDMGDGCFNPQQGYLDEVPGTLKANDKYKTKKKAAKKDNPFELNTFNSDDIALVECQEGRYFDIFCGKESTRKKVAKSKLEVWIDTSSSMKNVDFTTEKSYCERRFFAAKLKAECKDGVSFSTFDTARSSLGSYDNLCDYMGSNDSRRIVSWIEANNSEHLVLITDVDEYKNEFRAYLERTSAIVRGIGIEPISTKKLMKMIPNFTKSCK